MNFSVLELSGIKFPRIIASIRNGGFSDSIRNSGIILCFIGLLILPGSLSANEKSVDGLLSIQRATELAVKNNPGLAEIKSRFLAVNEMSSQRGTLPDPIVSVGAMNVPIDTFSLDQEAMTQLQIGFSQVLPYPGKLNLRKKTAEFEAKAAGFSVEEKRLQLVNSVKNRWWQLYYIEKTIETISRNQQLLKQFIQVAKTKYETGQGLQQDVLLSQLELSRLIDKKIQVEAHGRDQKIHMNVLMGRSPQTDIILPSDVDKSLPTNIDENELYQLAKVSNPKLNKMEFLVSAADSRLKLAQRDLYPDFNLAMNYGYRSGYNPSPMGGRRSDFLSVMVGVKIPLYSSSKQDSAVRQRSNELQKQHYALLDKSNSLMADISSATNDYRRAYAQLNLYESGIVPQARQTVESMLSGYQVNEVDFLNLVRSQMTLLNYELQYWKSFTEAQQAISRLQAAVGKELTYD